jgi:hypothetical protein
MAQKSVEFVLDLVMFVELSRVVRRFGLVLTCLLCKTVVLFRTGCLVVKLGVLNHFFAELPDYPGARSETCGFCLFPAACRKAPKGIVGTWSELGRVFLFLLLY